MRPDDLSPLYHLTGPYNCKVQDCEMAQNLIAPAAWMLAIMLHKPAMVIEIGTSKGGLSSLLSSCTASYGGDFHTLDVHNDGDYNHYPLYGNARFHHGDCFEKIPLIQGLIQRTGRCFVLCDGGNKPKEFNTFSKFLKSGDVIAAHDWCDETVPDYSPTWWGWRETHTSYLELDGLDTFMPSWFQYSAWCVRMKT